MAAGTPLTREAHPMPIGKLNIIFIPRMLKTRTDKIRENVNTECMAEVFETTAKKKSKLTDGKWQHARVSGTGGNMNRLYVVVSRAAAVHRINNRLQFDFSLRLFRVKRSNFADTIFI